MAVIRTKYDQTKVCDEPLFKEVEKLLNWPENTRKQSKIVRFAFSDIGKVQLSMA